MDGRDSVDPSLACPSHRVSSQAASLAIDDRRSNLYQQPYNTSLPPTLSAGSFASEILSAVNTLLAHQEALLTDVAEGRLGAGWDPDRTSSPLVAPSEEILSELGPLLQPNPDLAAELSEVNNRPRPWQGRHTGGLGMCLP